VIRVVVPQANVAGGPALSLLPNPIDEIDARSTSAELIHVLLIITGATRW
jgi:hypothetical protein